jgi:hypothetical protein
MNKHEAIALRLYFISLMYPLRTQQEEERDIWDGYSVEDI